MAAPQHESNGLVNGTETHDASFAFGTTVPVPPNIGQSPDYQAKKPANAQTGFKLGNFSMDDLRPMKVAIIGAGFSGITAGIRFLQKIPNIQLTIYESNPGIGGTWYVNRYPGLACDIPAHAYQLTFAGNPNWSQFYAPGPEILTYLNSVVDKYKLRPYIKLQHRVTRAAYDETSGKWVLTGTTNEGSSDSAAEPGVFEDTVDFLFPCLGVLSRWHWPDIEGLETFEGTLIHSADWKTGEGDPESGWETTVKSWGDKRIGVIGVGSTALQIVPNLQPKVKYLANYVRGQTWVASTFVREHLKELAKDENAENYIFTEEDKKKYSDPDYYAEYRRSLENELNNAHVATLRGHPMQEGGVIAFTALMKQRLQKKPWIADHLIPSFAVACRRLTPGAGYLEALCEDNVDFVHSPIKRITPTGIETEDGDVKELDVIICATGFDTSGKISFPILGRNGVDLSEEREPYPRTYLGITTDGFPNMFQSMGPNTGVGAGSLLLIMEHQINYAVAVISKLQRERLKSIEVTKEAVDDFDEYIESYFPTSVFGTKCRSWYKKGKEEGRVIALWPGSCLHAARALQQPRWEDFHYEPLDSKTKNRFYWLGDGSTVADRDPSADRAWYLNDDYLDIPPIPRD